jgi:hypothetical protein
LPRPAHIIPLVKAGYAAIVAVRRAFVAFGLTLLAAIGAAVHAQPLDRLTGRVALEQSQATQSADVRVEAIFGFAGGEFVGQRVFSTQTNAKGAWALLGFKAGVWLFDASAPGHLPDVIALPFNLVSPPGSGLSGMMPAWHPVLRPTVLPPAEIGQMLSDAVDAVRAGRPERATPLLARLADSGDPGVLVAAGRLCLLMKDPTVARPFFRRALERDAASFGAAVGMGSSALMQRDVDAAARAFDDARKLTKDKDERGYLSAAINELNKAHNVMRGTE